MQIDFANLKIQHNLYKEEIEEAILKVARDCNFIMGSQIDELERNLEKFTGSKYAISCSSGTDALLLAMMALDIQPDDEIITTPFTFFATAETIAFLKAKPVFVDIDEKTYNIDPKKIEAAITPKTKAIIPVSLYGQPADMDEINQIAKKYNLKVIVDGAQSFGSTYKGISDSNLGDISCTSFFPAKPLGCYGDGGAIFTNDDELHKAMKEIKEHGSESRYYHTRLGVNGRLDSIQCAILLAKMERYDWEVEQRQKIGNYFTEGLSQIKTPGFSTPFIKSDRDCVWAQYTLMVPDRPLFQKKMQELGVPTVVHYPRIMPDQPWYKEHTPQQGDWTYSRLAAEHVVSLPMYPDMDRATQDKIIDSVIKVMS